MLVRRKPPPPPIPGPGPAAVAPAAARVPRSTAAFWPLWLAAVLVPALGFALAAWISWGNVQAEARDRLGRRGDVLREHAANVFEVQEAVLAAVEHRVRGMDWDAIAGSAELLDFLRALDRSTPSSDFITLAAPDGRIALHSRLAAPGWTGLDASDRDWFRRALAAGPGGGTVVSEVVRGRLDGTPFFSLSRARRGQEGGNGADGVLAVSLTIEALADLYRSIAESPRDAIALVRADGAVLVRYPAPPEGFGGRALPDSPVVAAHRDSATGRGFVRTVSDSDGVERLVAFRRIEGYPVFVAHGLDTAVPGAAWRRQLLAPGLGALAAAGLLLWLTARARRAARSEAEALARATAEAEHARAEAERRAEAEARLREGQRVALLGQLAAGVAHDFRNVVQAVQGGVRLIERDPGDPERVRDLVRLMGEAAGRGGALTQRMLDFARGADAARGGPAATDPRAAVSGACELLSRTLGSGYRLRCEIAAEGLPPLVRGNRAELEAAVANLVINARDAMPDGGEVVVSAAPEAVVGAEDGGGGARPAGLAPGLYVRVSVADTGVGMAPEVLARVAEPFFTTKPHGKGTGLGLASARAFVEGAGGALTIESEARRGTTATLWLPAAEDAAGGGGGGVASSGAGSWPGPAVRLEKADGGVQGGLRRPGCRSSPPPSTGSREA